MLQANYSDSLDVPPSLPTKAEEEFAQMTYAFLDKYLEDDQISSVQVVIQWDSQKGEDPIAQPITMAEFGCYAESGNNRCPRTNPARFWGRRPRP